MKKTKRRRVSSEWDEMEDLISKIPLLNSFAGNPLGTVIAIVLLMMAFLYWDSNAPTNPFVNEPGFQTAVWGNLYTNYNWFLILAVPFFLVGIILQAFREMDDEEKAGSIVGRGPGGGTSLNRVFAARPRGLNIRRSQAQRPSITIIQDLRGGKTGGAPINITPRPAELPA